MGHLRDRLREAHARNVAVSLFRTTAFCLVLGILLLAWQSLPGHALPAKHATGPALASDRLVTPVQSPGDPGDWCPPGMSLCDASVCCKKGWRCCRGGCCPPQFRWACDTNRKCYRSKALRSGPAAPSMRSASASSHAGPTSSYDLRSAGWLRFSERYGLCSFEAIAGRTGPQIGQRTSARWISGPLKVMIRH